MAEGEDRSEKGDGAPARGLDPIGQALRATFDAENHDSLGRDLTGLMLELARIEAPAPPPAPAAAAPPSWFARLFGRPRR